MKFGYFAWKVIGIIVTLATAATPLYVAYDLWGRGTTPEKQVDLSQFDGINPLRDLSPLGGRASLKFHIDNQTTSSLIISQAYLKNVGKSPIIPADYIEPLTVSVKSPWKIVAVANSADFSSFVQLHWTRVDETKFKAEPSLLNPGDQVATYVYVTNSQTSSTKDELTSEKPEVEWNARIVNLKAFNTPSNFFDQVTHDHWGINIELYGWSLLFTLGFTLLFQALYLHLLIQNKLLNDWSEISILITLSTTLMSLTASESIATYLFGNTLTKISGVNHWLNLPPIILHVFFVGYLYLRVHKSEKQRGQIPS